MKKIRAILVILFVLFVFNLCLFSDIKKVGQAGYQFLKIGTIPRAAGMGEAYSMVGYDASAMFFNPAGLGNMEERFDFNVGQVNWFAGVKYSYACTGLNLGNWGVIGFNILSADYGDDIIGTRVASTGKGYVETGRLEVGAYVFGVAYARKISNKFTVGGQVRYAGQHLGENLMPDGNIKQNKTSGFVFDFGTIYYPGIKSFRFGASFRNFAKEYKYEKESFELPLTFTIGAAVNLMDFFDIEDHSLLIAIDAMHPRDYSERLNIGVEYLFNDMIAIRCGYKYN
ncbi:MAG: PorV/PorQ family protein, partial [Armatimonadetes bacterium]|nr:PorV/PorQ family protein [Armatimonadota bacterium]